MDLQAIATQMFNAAFAIVKDKAPDIENYAKGEFVKIAQTFGTIETEMVSQKITAEQARILLDMQKSATRAVLLTSAGLSLLVAEQAINAALAVVKTTVNDALKFALL